MITAILPALFLLAQSPAPAPAPVAPPAKTEPAKPQDLKPLSFLSQRLPFRWDQVIKLDAEVDGLKLKSIFFNKRTVSLLKGAEFGTRAVLEVTNTAGATRVPGFAVAVFDSEDRLLGVATGGPKIGGVSAGETETFDLSFSKVNERIPRADHFYLAVELTD
jgi:hypothetical protein